MDAVLVREMLLKVWGEQACQHPNDWPAVQARFLAKLSVDDAVAELVRLFDGGPPADPVLAVWRVFPKLDRAHCARLATLLTETQPVQAHKPAGQSRAKALLSDRGEEL